MRIPASKSRRLLPLITVQFLGAEEAISLPREVRAYDKEGKLLAVYPVTIGSQQIWIWLSTAVILIGAELDAEMEHQTTRDTTTGEGRPLGKRGARMADTVGATH